MGQFDIRVMLSSITVLPLTVCGELELPLMLNSSSVKTHAVEAKSTTEPNRRASTVTAVSSPRPPVPASAAVACCW